MSNKTNIEEDINTVMKLINTFKGNIYLFYSVNEKEIQAIENILADRERLEKENEIQEDNYQILSSSVSSIAKKLKLQEDATIDEIYTAISILKSKRINMFEQLDCIAKANKYDSLVEKMEDKIIRLKEYNAKLKEKLVNAEMGTNIQLIEEEISKIENQIKLLQELLDIEKEN